MKQLNEIIESLNLDNQITLEDIPGIDLYMDQVIQLFEKKYSSTTRNKEEKVLTKTMINNYAKGKLLFPIKNKKYSSEHLILISLIYQLKGGLSINDIKAVLGGINKSILEDNFNLNLFYSSYLNVFEKNIESFKNDVQLRTDLVKKEIEALGEQDIDYLEQVLLIASFVNMSNFYRRVAEKIVDEIIEETDSKEQ